MEFLFHIDFFVFYAYSTFIIKKTTTPARLLD